MTTWFHQLFGFEEGPYDDTQQRFVVEGDRLRSIVNGRRFGIGTFATPSLAALRAEAGGLRPGRLRVTHEIIGDVLELHALPDNEGALFQAASQLNCLEFAGPEKTPEDGVTQYVTDPTQGPACALAAAAATVYRNYFVDVGDGAERGQRRHRQLNNLARWQQRLGPDGARVEVRNGYTFCDAAGLRAIAAAIARHDRVDLMGELAIGLHSGVEVTFARRFVEPDAPRTVSQAFCSAVSCGYAGGPREAWAPLATLVLDAAYEATLLAAAIDAARAGGSGKVWLTLLGGGAFGNDPAWIASAIARAVSRLADRDLDVRIAHFRQIDPAIRDAVR